MRDLQIDEDMFFIKQDFYKANIDMLKDALVLTENDFFNHFKYATVNNISNHETWGIDFDYVIITKNNWFESKSLEFREKLKEETIKNGDALLCGHTLITKKVWSELDSASKEKFFKDNDDELVDTNLNSIEGFDYLKEWHNVFPSKHGANCFASVIFAISKSEDLINEWIFADTLLLFLEANHYEKRDDIKKQDLIKAEDVLIIFDDDKPIHAIYCLDEKMCFNKFGQTMHEPWSICPINDVLSEFEGSWKIYRKNNSISSHKIENFE